GAVFSERADGAGGAADQGVQGLASVLGRSGLAADEGVSVALREDGGGELATGVAVDARLVHEEIAGGVLRDALLDVRHGRGPSSPRGLIHCRRLSRGTRFAMNQP